MILMVGVLGKYIVMNFKEYFLLENEKWNDVEEMTINFFMVSGGGHPASYTFKDMLKLGYTYYYPYFYALSHHEAMANVVFIRSKKRPTKEIEGDFYTHQPENFLPMIDEESFKRELEKIYDKMNEWEMDAIDMGNPRVKGWGN
jgi:hypothetical protein